MKKTEEAIKPQVQVQPDAGLARYPLPKPKMSEEDCVHPLPQRLSVPDGEGGTYRVCGVCNKTVGVG